MNAGILVSALALGMGGCVAQGRVGGTFEARGEPMLVEINPGVWVIEDYSEPVFYVDGFYWLYRDDVWFRSSYYTGGWARVQSAPQVVLTIGRPTAYVHYQAGPGVRVRSGPRGAVVVRGHEDNRNAPRGQPSDNRDVRTPGPEQRAPAPQPDRPRATPPDQGEKPDKQDKPSKPDDRQPGNQGQGDKGQGDKGQGDKGQGDKGQGDKGHGDKGHGDKRKNP